jgi:UDP-glucose:(heptosyl)LPS alpha-1,3-glucosyltransferase
MKIAFCYESVVKARGGAETYIGDLARRLVADGHEVHLYACDWDAASLPEEMHFHRLPTPRGPRFLRPWLFGTSCRRALLDAGDQVSIGFNKTWGQDILYPQGGLHIASSRHNLRKYRDRLTRVLARIVRCLDIAHLSFTLLERRQYLSKHRPLIVVNSDMVAHHFQKHYGISATDLRIVRSAIDPDRFLEPDRPRRRLEARERWGIDPEETVALFAAMNYRLKGLDPLLHAVRLLPPGRRFRLLVVGNPRTHGYEKQARRLGIHDRVCFAGHCDEMRDSYFAADFLVHPTFYDPCSLVVLEALACGLPVITTEANGASELLHPPQEGYVISDPHHYERLAWCMEQLLDPARRSACARAARLTAAQWTFEAHYRQLLDAITEAAARRHAA